MVHCGRKRGQGGRTFVHEGPSVQPRSRAVWEVDLPILIPGSLVPACIRTLHRCCGLWWKSDLNWVRSNYHLGLFLVEFVEWVKQEQGGGTADDWSSRLGRMAAEGLSFGISVSEMARQARMSLNQFTRKFKAERGILPREFLLNLRMDQARHLLQDTGLYNGQTPSAWRRQIT